MVIKKGFVTLSGSLLLSVLLSTGLTWLLPFGFVAVYLPIEFVWGSDESNSGEA